MTEPRRSDSVVLEKLALRKAAYQKRSLPYKIAYVTTGALVTLLGCVMIVTPGPAFVLIPLGLTMLSMQFDWALSLLDRAVAQAEKAKDTTPKQRILSALGFVVLVAIVIAAIFLLDIHVPVLNPK